MKKKIIITVVIILALAAFFYFRFKPHGEIKEPEKITVSDNGLYKELSSSAYRGEVNYKSLIFVFKPENYEKESFAEYECAVLEDDENPFSPNSVYEVKIDEDKISMEYIVGSLETTFDCEYQNGELTVNGVKLEKFPLNEIKDCVYGYNSDLIE